MDTSPGKSIEILERTPKALRQLLDGLSSEWTSVNEGGDTWSVYDVVGHLIHGDRTDWIVRVELIMTDAGEKRFTPFNRFAQFEASRGRTLAQLLDEFEAVREASLERLRRLDITAQDLTRTALHPSFGVVTLSQLLSTWVVHDLDHISQIARVMARQYQQQVGPWITYLKILGA